MTKKIGVITYHNVTNYGAVMQAYCLQKALREISSEAGVSVDVEVIDYRPWRSVFYYYLRHFVKRRELSYFKKIIGFAGFRKKYLKESQERTYSSDKVSMFASKYDLVITGSDEVWKVGEIRGWDSNYFLSFIDSNSNTKKASYAVSANAAKGLDERVDEIKSYLSGYIGTSVRDSKTKLVVKDLFDIEAVEVLDPTLITDSEVSLSDIKADIGKYVLLYSTLKKVPDNLSKYAKSNGLKIVSVGNKMKGCDISFPNATPELWLSLINGADLVITNFFHGVLLSIKMKTNFLPMYSGNKRFKISDISEKLGFKDKLVEQKTFKHIELESIESHIVRNLSEGERFIELYTNSRKYLYDLIEKIK